MPLHGRDRIGTGKISIQPQAIDIKGKYLEMVMVNDDIVPGRAGTVIAAVSTAHFGISREPSGVLIDPANAIGRRTGRFTPRGDSGVDGTSGSTQITTKLLVLSGTFDHSISGLIFVLILT